MDIFGNHTIKEYAINAAFVLQDHICYVYIILGGV